MTQSTCERHDLLDALCFSFRHVQVRPLLETITWPLEKCFQQLAPQSNVPKLRRALMGSPIDYLTPHETVQVCLLWSRPFCEPIKNDRRVLLAEDLMSDLRYPARVPFRCRNRPLVIEAWADAFVQYEMESQVIEGVIQGLPAEMVHAASVMESTLRCFFRLRDQGKLAKDNPLRDRHREKVLADVQDLAQLVGSLATEEVAQGRGNASRGDRWARVKVNLFRRMHRACNWYGPQSCPYTARDHAIAVISQDFRIENGAQEASLIAERYRKRLQGCET